MGSLKTKISQTNTKAQISVKKKKLTVRQGRTKHMCRISGSSSQKRRGHWTVNEFGAISLNQPVYNVVHQRAGPFVTISSPNGLLTLGYLPAVVGALLQSKYTRTKKLNITYRRSSVKTNKY